VILWFSERLRKEPTAFPAFFSELDCAIVSTMGRTKNFALKNQIYCGFSGSVACQVLIKQSSEKKKDSQPFVQRVFRNLYEKHNKLRAM